MNIGLYFGSFNPIHIGHMAIANYIVEYSPMDELWFVVSAQNPLKERRTLLASHHRLEMVERAINDDHRFRISDIELKMPAPSFTIDTLAWLSEKHPAHKFSIIMGSDQLPHFHKWKNAAQIETHYHRFVYPRPGYDADPDSHTNLTVVKAPMIEISSSFIRNAIRQGKDVRHFLPAPAWRHLDEMNFYRKD
jgi:nicotinate-nucleotide adenylyltransferase